MKKNNNSILIILGIFALIILYCGNGEIKNKDEEKDIKKITEDKVFAALVCNSSSAIKSVKIIELNKVAEYYYKVKGDYVGEKLSLVYEGKFDGEMKVENNKLILISLNFENPLYKGKAKDGCLK